MNPNIVWKEGMPLLPHHFQRAQEATLMRLHAHCGEPSSRGYGFAELSFDEELLASSGQLALRKCRGIFPEGTIFDISWLPHTPIQSVPEDLGVRRDRLTVFVAMPSGSESAPRFGEDAKAPFLESFRSYADLATGSDPREVSVAVPNLSLRLEDAGEGFLGMAAAQIVRAPNGRLALAEDFVPALLNIHAWPPLATELSRLCDAVAMRLSELSRQNPSSNAEIERLHLAIGNARLEHLRGCQEIHPERLYSELLSLVAGLAALRGQSPPQIAYRHAATSSCLRELGSHLRQLLRQVPSRKTTAREMRREGQALFIASLGAEVLDGTRRLILAIRSGMAPEKLSEIVLRQAKAAPRSKLQAIIQSALRGIELRKCTTQVDGADPASVCFELLPDASLWPKLQEEGELAVYVPTGLEVESIELMAEEA